MEMKLQRDEWARVPGLLDTALDLPEPDRPAWLDALALDRPHLKTALRRLLENRRAIETADFLAAGAEAGVELNAVPAPAAEHALALQRFTAARERLFGAGLHERHPLRAELLARDPARAERAAGLYRSLLGVALPLPLLVLH